MIANGSAYVATPLLRPWSAFGGNMLRQQPQTCARAELAKRKPFSRNNRAELMALLPACTLSGSKFAVMIALSSASIPANQLLAVENIEGDVQLYFRIFLGGLGIIASGFIGALVIGAAAGGNLQKLEDQYQKNREKQLEIEVEDDERENNTNK
uniref:Uncharacterized protein n=1 Tax=Erythrolobus australicus TaxID=1077150 RepID=A0A7S1TKL7_9RHOD|mmetsp:Transcript_2796/g.7699  ORF Transcript_2796/g.7699 Transcript_2796/m.7699 type:complete len:154 (+) Transcript_2796:36-497(+)